MNKIASFFIIIVSFLFVSEKSFSQADINYWDKAGYFNIYAGAVMPGHSFSNTNADGLFAKNGFQFGVDANYFFGYGFGLGFNYELNNFFFDRNSFFKYSNAKTIKSSGGYLSNKYALNVLYSVPVLLGSDDYILNFYVEGNAGLRTMNIPDIDLTYNEIANKYVEVSYRARSNIMGYLGYSIGLQVLFSNKYGVNLSYNAVLPSRHSIKYSSRRFDAAGKLYEDETYLHDVLDHTGIQLGFLFIMGKK